MNNMNNNVVKQLTVKQYSVVSQMPDTIEIPVTLEIRDIEYDKTLEKLTSAYSDIENILVGLEFDKKDIKTENFNIYTDYRNEKNEEGVYVNVFNGYIAKHSLKISFDYNTELLSKIINALAKSSTNAQFNIMFTVKNSDNLYEALLKKATKEAYAKAKVLAEASNVSLGSLLSINYNSPSIRTQSPMEFSIQPKARLMSAALPDITPEDVSISDVVEFSWQIV